MTCNTAGSATSSPASAGGPSPSPSPAGRQGELFGPGLAPASPSARRGRGRARPTSGTSGPIGSVSSKPADPPPSSASKSPQPKSSESKAKDREYHRTYRRRHRARDLVRHARFRANKKGLPFDLLNHLEAIQQRINQGVCEVSGLPFNLDGGRTWDSPSLDRIDSTKGYLIGNVRVVCHAVNSAMGDWGEAKMLEIAHGILNRRRDASNALSERLGQSLMKRLGECGSPEYLLTWSRLVTPAGRVLYRLRASAPRTSGSASSGWPTPLVNDTGGSTHCYGGWNPDGSRVIHLKLPGAAKLAMSGWPTPWPSQGTRTTARGARNRTTRPIRAWI
jgi:hypothetical protein